MGKTLQNINSKAMGENGDLPDKNKRQKLYRQVKEEMAREKKRDVKRDGSVKKIMWGTLALVGALGMSLPTSAATTPTRNAAPYLDNVVTEFIITEIDETNNTFTVLVEENGTTSPFTGWEYSWLYANDGSGTPDSLLSGMTNRRGEWTTLYSHTSQTEPIEKGTEVKLTAFFEPVEGSDVSIPTLSKLATQEISYVMRTTKALEDGTLTGWYTVGRYNYSDCYRGLTDKTGVICRAERYTNEDGVEMVRYNPILPENTGGENGDNTGNNNGGSSSSDTGDGEGGEGSGGNDDIGGNEGGAGTEDSNGSGDSGENDSDNNGGIGDENKVDGDQADGESKEKTIVTQVVERVIEKTYEIVRAVTNEVPGATRLRYVYSSTTNGASGATEVKASADSKNDDLKNDEEVRPVNNWEDDSVVKNNETEVTVPPLGEQKTDKKDWIMPAIIGMIIGASVMGVTWWLFGGKRRKDCDSENI